MTTLDDLEILERLLVGLCVHFDKSQEWGECSPEALEAFRRAVREAVEDVAPRLERLPQAARPYKDVPLPIRLGTFQANSYCNVVLDIASAVDYRLECRIGRHPIADIVVGIREVIPYQSWYGVADNVKRELTEAAQRATRILPPEQPAVDVEDDSAYVLASTLDIEGRFSSLSQFGKWLDSSAGAVVRSRKPSPQRREVHAGDYARYWADHDRKQSELLDDESLQQQIADIEARRADERSKKAPSRTRK